MKKALIITAMLLLVACGSESFEGDYAAKSSGNNPFSAMTQPDLSFTDDGKVRILRMGNRVAVYKYEKNGDEITLFKGDGTTQIFTIEKDGSLFGGGMEFVKLDGRNSE